MLHIIYTPADAEFMQKIQDELTRTTMYLENTISIVLLSPEARADKDFDSAIQAALDQGHILLPVMLRKTTLPPMLEGMGILDMSRGLQPQKIAYALRRADIAQATKRSNWQILAVLAVLALIVFSAAIWGIGTGRVAFPRDEYATEDALRDAQIQTLTFPTIGPLLPRTTEDALAFPQTVEAANTRNAPLLRATASAMPRDRQATLDAIATSADMTLTARAEATQTAASD